MRTSTAFDVIDQLLFLKIYLLLASVILLVLCVVIAFIIYYIKIQHMEYLLLHYMLIIPNLILYQTVNLYILNPIL